MIYLTIISIFGVHQKIQQANYCRVSQHLRGNGLRKFRIWMVKTVNIPGTRVGDRTIKKYAGHSSSAQVDLFQTI